MSGRNKDDYRDHCGGSSRSGRHYSDRDNYHRSRRERSRSGERSSSRDEERTSHRDKEWNRDKEERSKSHNYSEQSGEVEREVSEALECLESEENVVEVPAPPPPPRITKISIGFNKPAPKPNPVKLSLAPAATVTPAAPKKTVASVFNQDDDDDDEPEEMPAEARMRMRNIGRETPTSAGPNSFGKTKQGFCDINKVFERNMKKAIDQVSGDKAKPPANLPQTIYKIGGNNC